MGVKILISLIFFSFINLNKVQIFNGEQSGIFGMMRSDSKKIPIPKIKKQILGYFGCDFSGKKILKTRDLGYKIRDPSKIPGF